MSKRTTREKIEPAKVTEEEMRAALEDYVLNYCAAAKVEAAAKQKIEKLKIEANTAMKPSLDLLARSEAVITQYVKQNREQFCEPHPRKKDIYGGHKIGLQTGQPSVTFITPTGEKGRQTEEGFIEMLRGTDEFSAFVRTIEQMDKDAIISERRKFATAEDAEDALREFDAGMAALGVRVTQRESVVIDLNLQPQTAE